MSERGFTLVELMVAMLVMGLIATAVVLATRPSNPVSADAAQLAGRIAAARDLAVTGNRPISLWVDQSGYGFDELQGGKWRPVSRPPLGAAQWPSATAVQASGLAGRAAAAANGSARITFDNLGLPDTAADLALSRDDLKATVTIGGDGGVRVR